MTGPWHSAPVFAIDADLSWLLRVAFAEAWPAAPADSEKALRFARDLEISGRIAERLRRLDRPRVTELEAEFDADFQTNLAVDAQLAHALRHVSGIAVEHAIPVIALKYAALSLSAAMRPGTRVAGDLDLLVPAAGIERLWQALLRAGYQRANTRAHAHQLEALVGPFGAVVELHRHLPGVCVRAQRFATAEDLFSASLVQASLGSPLWSPKPAILAAHALAHGLLQNRATPQSYSLLRMLSDLVDLRTAATPSPIPAASEYCSPALSGAAEIADRLCSALQRGAFQGTDFDDTAEQRLLWHCLAARLDVEYAQRLRFSPIFSGNGGLGVSERLRYFVGAIFPAEHELDTLFGPARSTSARVGRRLRRPIDLASRLVRYWSRKS